MEKTNLYSGNSTLMQQFAVKSEKKQIVYGDRAITYNRCSTKKQDSIGWQSKVTGTFTMHKNWTLVKSFGAKESAKTDDRTVFNEMREFCARENISHIVFYSYDRFSRAGNLGLIDELRKEGIKVHSATQDLDDDTMSGRMMQKILMIMAEAENQMRQQKIIEGMKNKLRNGEWITKPPPGYEKRFVNGRQTYLTEKKQCFINETGNTLVQAFYWKDNENLTDDQIVDRLETMGLKLTSKKLRRIFRNPFYCGYITHSLLDDGEINRGKHEPLIDEATFLRINGILSRNPHGWKKTNHDEDMPLKASVRCGLCGLPLTGYVQKKIYVYYKCRNIGCCVNLAGKKLHQIFVDKLAGIAIAGELIPVVKKQLESTYWMLHKSEVVRVKPMKDETARLKSELEVMELNHATGKLSEELFLKHSKAHKQSIGAIEAELAILSRDTSNLGLYLDKTLNFLRNLPEMWQKLNLDGKIRLQKLAFPEGLQYNPENDTLRTLTVNPIFSAITSISSNLAQSFLLEKETFGEKSHQLYLGFPSSNFLWENLEKTAVALEELKGQLAFLQKPVVSMTGETPTSMHFYSSNSTQIPNTNTRISELFQGISSSYTGTTNQQLTR